MISSMHQRIAGFVTLLGLAVSAASRPALAQPADGDWFDDTGTSAADAPAAPDAPIQPAQPAEPAQDMAPQEPAYGPQGQPLSPDPNASAAPQGPQGPQDNQSETDPRALTEFRPALDPYGTWVQDEKYGTVWVPNRDTVGDDFAPYVSAGHWALTEDNDWAWQSDYPFGGVVFHYGRWVWVPGTGWAWVAGRRYANAWVTWRVPSDDYGYLGWAPMPPAWGWYGGSAVSLGWYPPAPYVFCPSGYAFSYNVHSYIVHDRYVIHDIAGHTRNYSSGASIAPGGHSAASPRAANSAPPRGPSLQSAHIPPYAAPASRVAGNGSFSGGRGSMSTPYVRSSGSASARPYSASSYGGQRAYVSPSSYARPSGYARPSYSRPADYPSYRAATPRPSSAYVSPSVTPQRPYYAAPSSRSYSVPVRSSYPAPVQHYSEPAAHYSAPVTHYAAPAAQYSAPARSYSAPARAYSAPSFHAHSRR